MSGSLRVAEQSSTGWSRQRRHRLTHEIPFGGFKESGLGARRPRGIAEYTEVKSVVLNLG